MGEKLSTLLAEQILVDPLRRDVIEDARRRALGLEALCDELTAQRDRLQAQLMATKERHDALFGVVGQAIQAGVLQPDGSLPDSV
jgi:hypothetical protein